MQERNMPPFAPVLMQSTRAIGYSLEAAIADIIDNSIAAKAGKVQLSFFPVGDAYVSILDNGTGMDDAQMNIAMQYGSKSPTETRDSSDLGRYGLGLKTASLSQCRVLTVISKQGDQVIGRRWDLDYVIKTGAWSLLILDKEDFASVPHISDLYEQDSGTLVVWQNLDRLLMGEVDYEKSLGRKMDEVRQHLELVFHRYLSGESGIKKLEILFNGVMLSENKKRMVVAICAEEEISSIEWARLKKDKWVNRSISCPEYVQSIYKMMNWNKECRYKIYGRLANSERGLVLVFDLASAVMFDPLPEEYFDKHTGKMKKRIVKYYPDEIRMKLGRSYSDYEALQQRSSFESLSGYMDTSGGAVPATVSEELAASISMQEQKKKRETLFGTIIGNGGDDDVRNNE